MPSNPSRPGSPRPSVPCRATRGPSSEGPRDPWRWSCLRCPGRDPEAGGRSAATGAAWSSWDDHPAFAYAAQLLEDIAAVRRRETVAAVATTRAGRCRMSMETAPLRLEIEGIMGRDVQLPARAAHVQRGTRERGRWLRHPAPLVQGISATTDRVCQHLLAGRTRVDRDWANGPCALPTSTPFTSFDTARTVLVSASGSEGRGGAGPESSTVG
jgi:hypothetical protein